MCSRRPRPRRPPRSRPAGGAAPASASRCPAGGEAAFVAGLNTDTGATLFLKQIDGPGVDVANGIAYGDANNALYIAGGAEGTSTVNANILATTSTPLSARLWKVS